METITEIPQSSDHRSRSKGILARFGQILFFLILQAAILFLVTGRLDWIWAWVYLAISVLSIAVNAVFMMSRAPETVAERGRPEGGKDWDKRVGGLWGITQFIALPLVASLDVRSYWTLDLSMWWHLSGVLLFALGSGIFGWAMITNVFFSTAVRIQTDRGHAVCRTGPYRYVRHPGYVGVILQSFGIPILLGSLWGLIPGFIAVVLIIFRTSMEDQTLLAELSGYSDFSKETRFRLLPGVW